MGIALQMHSALVSQANEELRRLAEERHRAEQERAAFHQAATTGDVLEGEFTDITDQKLLPPPGDP